MRWSSSLDVAGVTGRQQCTSMFFRRVCSLVQISLALIFLQRFSNGSVAADDPSPDIIEIKYRLEEEPQSGWYIGSVVEDAKLDELYSREEMERLNFRFLRQHMIGFAIDPTTGVIRTNGRLDREAFCPGSDTCIVRLDIAIQPQQYFRIVRVTVSILDRNDNAPTFSDDELSFDVLESAHPGTGFPIPVATDPDIPEFAVRGYRLVSDTDAFELREIRPGGPTSAVTELRLVLAQGLDRELVDRYRIKVLAVDGEVATTSNTGSVEIDVNIIDVNDNSPIFLQSEYDVTVKENIQIQTTLLKVHATDNDLGLNGQLIYALSPLTTIAHGDLFGIVPSTGDIFVKGVVDFEVAPSYQLVLMASDLGADSIPGTATVTVRVQDLNDNVPEVAIDTLSSSPEVSEMAENADPGAFIAHLTVTDRDGGQNGRFRCSLNDIRFRLRSIYESEYQIVTVARLDREVHPQHVIDVNCTDLGDPPRSTIKTISVTVADTNDNEPTFEQFAYHGELIENSYVGAVILQVMATDADAGSNAEVVYSIEGGTQGDRENFTIDPSTGVIKAAVSFDREDADQLRFYVVARDRGVPSPRSSSAAVVVTILDVNDETPQFDGGDAYQFRVYENELNGTVVGSVFASDMDAGINGWVRYTMSSDHPTDAFVVDHETGQIRTARNLDRESQSVFYLEVIANDMSVSPLRSTASVTISVDDRNDNPPRFDITTSAGNGTFYISNMAAPDTVIVRLTAHDADSGNNARLTYDLIARGDDRLASPIEDDQLFGIDEHGNIRVNRRGLIDRDGTTFALTVMASDGGSPPMTTILQLFVSVNGSVGLNAQQTDDDHLSIFAGRTLVVVLTVAIGVSTLSLCFVMSIVMLCRRRAGEKNPNKYNCRVEELKVLSKSATRDLEAGAPAYGSICTYQTTGEKTRRDLIYSNDVTKNGHIVDLYNAEEMI